MPTLETRVSAEIPVRTNAVGMGEEQRIARKCILIGLQLSDVMSERAIVGNNAVAFAVSPDHRRYVADSAEIAVPVLQIEHCDGTRRPSCRTQGVMNPVHEVCCVELGVPLYCVDGRPYGV